MEEVGGGAEFKGVGQCGCVLKADLPLVLSCVLLLLPLHCTVSCSDKCSHHHDMMLKKMGHRQSKGDLPRIQPHLLRWQI